MYVVRMSSYTPQYQILMELVTDSMFELGGFLWLPILGSEMSVSVLSIVACISIFLDLVNNIHSPTCM